MWRKPTHRYTKTYENAPQNHWASPYTICQWEPPPPGRKGYRIDYSRLYLLSFWFSCDRESSVGAGEVVIRRLMHNINVIQYRFVSCLMLGYAESCWHETSPAPPISSSPTSEQKCKYHIEQVQGTDVLKIHFTFMSYTMLSPQTLHGEGKNNTASISIQNVLTA